MVLTQLLVENATIIIINEIHDIKNVVNNNIHCVLAILYIFFFFCFAKEKVIKKDKQYCL